MWLFQSPSSQLQVENLKGVPLPWMNSKLQDFPPKLRAVLPKIKLQILTIVQCYANSVESTE
eukprot:c17886_g1_i1 orf=270-455(+)